MTFTFINLNKTTILLTEAVRHVSHPEASRKLHCLPACELGGELGEEVG